MRFSPGGVLDWYRGRPTWQRWALILFVAVAFVLALFWWVLGRMVAPRGGETVTDTALDILEGQLAEDEKAAEAKDRELADKIEREKAGREARKTEREERQKENEERHDEIDNTPDSAHDVVGLLDPDRRRRRG